MSTGDYSVKKVVYQALKLTEGNRPGILALTKRQNYNGGREEGLRARQLGAQVRTLLFFEGELHQMFTGLKREDIAKVDNDHSEYFIVQINSVVGTVFVLIEKVQKVSFKLVVINDKIAIESTYASDWGMQEKQGFVFLVKPLQCFSCGDPLSGKKTDPDAPSNAIAVGCDQCKQPWFVWCDECCRSQDADSHRQACSIAKKWPMPKQVEK